MSRESAAACPLRAGELPLLTLHRLTPEHSLLALRAGAAQVGNPICHAALHVAECATCGPEPLVVAAPLCAHGARLIEAARGWRERAA